MKENEKNHLRNVEKYSSKNIQQYCAMLVTYQSYASINSGKNIQECTTPNRIVKDW